MLSNEAQILSDLRRHDAEIQRLKLTEVPRVLSNRVVNVLDKGADPTGVVDSTSSFIKAIAALPSSNGVFYVPNGVYKITDTLVNTKTSIRFMMNDAQLIFSKYNQDAIRNTASDFSIEGGDIVSPATFDDTNATPTYGVIHSTGANTRILNITLTNVPRVGIFNPSTDNLMVHGCIINGNMPYASVDDVGHWGIYGSRFANIVGNKISGCVQGVSLYGYELVNPAGSNKDIRNFKSGGVISLNNFEQCWNHGIYTGYSLDGISAVGNTFSQCQYPIVMVGPGHVVMGNVLYTYSTGDDWDLTSISMRDAIGCTVIGNTIYGDAAAGGSIIDLINLQDAPYPTEVSRNVVKGNTIITSGGSSVAIRVGHSAHTTVCNDNIVEGNIIKNVGRTTYGQICVSPAAGATAIGNQVINNDMTITDSYAGIYVLNSDHTAVRGNKLRWECNPGAPITVRGILADSSTHTDISQNDFMVLAGFGTNLIVQAIRELNATSGTRIISNYFDFASGSATLTQMGLLTNSDAFIDDRGAGSPSGVYYGSPGSRWSRSDGGASTSLYVKETANTSATWRAV